MKVKEMKRKLVLGLVVVTFVFSIIAVQPVAADVVYLDIVIQIKPGGIIVIDFDVVEETQFYGELRTTEGLAGLLVLDSSNYIKWRSGEDWSSIFLSSIDLVGITFNFTISEIDTWLFCFIAQPDSLTSSAIVVGIIWRRVADTITATTTEITDPVSEDTTLPTTTSPTPSTTTYQFGVWNFGSLIVILVASLLMVCGLVIGKRMMKQVEKELVSIDAKVFVICPYCGAKTEQGITKCQKCGADL